MIMLANNETYLKSFLMLTIVVWNPFEILRDGRKRNSLGDKNRVGGVREAFEKETNGTFVAQSIGSFE